MHVIVGWCGESFLGFNNQTGDILKSGKKSKLLGTKSARTTYSFEN